MVPDIKMAPQAKIFSFLDSVNAISKGKMTSEWTRMSKFSPAAAHGQGGNSPPDRLSCFRRGGILGGEFYSGTFAGGEFSP